jgi:hypothetical protein
MVGGFVCGLIACLIPVEVIQSWALDRTAGDDFKKFEAIGRAEAICWLVRISGPLIGFAAFFLLGRISNVTRFVSNAYQGWLTATQVFSVGPRSRSWPTLVLRAFFVSWCVLTLGHYCQAMMDSMTNWPYYRFRSGREVLPNISDSNRAVIRYLLQTTEPNSRIFVASDQKLYFLSYYLLPRRLYYQSHPDSEFVIPQPHLQRRMEAFQLAEIDPQSIERIAPDYVLEYFEQPDFVDRTRLLEDSAWFSFFRQNSHDPRGEPAYLVSLKRFAKDRSQ